MRKWVTRLGAVVIVAAAALAACNPAKAPEPAQSDAKAQSGADTLPPAGQFNQGDLSTQTWVTAFASMSANGVPPIRVCHVGPAINEDVSLAVVVQQDGAKQVGVARVPSGGVSKPIGDVEIQVDASAPHVIRSAPMTAAALVVWPPGTATLAAGPEAEAILAELAKGTTVKVKESGGSTTTSFPTAGLSEAIANCAKP